MCLRTLILLNLIILFYFLFLAECLRANISYKIYIIFVVHTVEKTEQNILNSLTLTIRRFDEH